MSKFKRIFKIENVTLLFLIEVARDLVVNEFSNNKNSTTWFIIDEGVKILLIFLCFIALRSYRILNFKVQVSTYVLRLRHFNQLKSDIDFPNQTEAKRAYNRMLKKEYNQALTNLNRKYPEKSTNDIKAVLFDLYPESIIVPTISKKTVNKTN